MRSGGEGQCVEGMWTSGILPSENQRFEQCRQELEDRDRVPYVVAEKCYGSGGNRECGFEVIPDPGCGLEGGYYGASWFSPATNASDAQSCAEKLRRLGHDARVRVVWRVFIADAAEVVIKYAQVF